MMTLNIDQFCIPFNLRNFVNILLLFIRFYHSMSKFFFFFTELGDDASMANWWILTPTPYTLSKEIIQVGVFTIYVL